MEIKIIKMVQRCPRTGFAIKFDKCMWCDYCTHVGNRDYVNCDYDESKNPNDIHNKITNAVNEED